jgi:imidazoleglycerol phosphate synthase glutamine amidotransferase subunit HisH
LFEGSEEDSGEPGLGFLAGKVVEMTHVPRLPQIGWNALDLAGAHAWLRDTRDGDQFYFVHSYVPEPTRPRDLLLLRPAILRTQQRVAAEGDDRQFAFCFAARRAQSEILALERHGHATRSAASP